MFRAHITNERNQEGGAVVYLMKYKFNTLTRVKCGLQKELLGFWNSVRPKMKSQPSSV